MSRSFWNQRSSSLSPLPSTAIGEPYTPAELTSEDYPELIDQDKTIETLAVPTIMAAFLWPSRHQKRAQLEGFQDALSESLDGLKQDPFHAKWREVDLEAEIAGWERF